MMFFRALSLVSLTLLPAIVDASEGSVPPATRQEEAPTADELNLDSIITVYEDVATALSSVDDSTDANLVASRVATDFLLLRGMGQNLADYSGVKVNSETMRSFQLRREQARSAVESARTRLRENSFYGSEALQAALSLSGLISGKSPAGPAAETAVQELLANNREMMSLLLDEAKDAATAEQVTNLIEAALRCETALSAYAKEVGNAHLDDEQRDFYSQRRKDFYIDLQNHRERLAPLDYFRNSFLREFIEGLLPVDE